MTTDFFHIMSMLPGNNLVMDIDQDPTTNKTAIGVSPRKQPPDDANQLWSFEPGTEAGFVFIHSKLNPNLVVDAQGNTGKEGELLALFPQNGGPNQQWSFQPLAGAGSTPGHPGVIRSLMGNRLVMDVVNFDTTKQMQVWPQNDGSNQLWFLPPPETEGSNATVAVFPVVGVTQSLVTLVGTGYEPGTGVVGNFLFSDQNSTPEPGSSGDFDAVTDLTGVWRSTIPVELVPNGDLAVHLAFAFPLVGDFLFFWDGSTFFKQE